MPLGKQRIIESLLKAQEAERASWAAERAEWQKERVSLLNRIQKPEVAAYQPSEPPSDELLYIPIDDDEAHAEYMEQVRAGELQ